MSRSRGWCFTINNYSNEELSSIMSYLENTYHGNYCIIGLEIGKEGTHHIQGYLYDINRPTFKCIKDQFPRAHIEAAKGTPQQNKEYCSKDGNFREFGTAPKQGRRSDLNDIKMLIKNGASMQSIHEEASSLQAIKFAESYIKYNEKKRDWQPIVIWLYGSTGSGKSRLAEWIVGKDAWWSGENLKWWQGYDAHENIVIDDFRADFCKYHTLLRILDRYPYTIENKGNSRQLLAKIIVITSCYPPDKVYKTREDIKQLTRRISILHNMNDCPEVKSNVQMSKMTIMSSLLPLILNVQKSG